MKYSILFSHNKNKISLPRSLTFAGAGIKSCFSQLSRNRMGAEVVNGLLSLSSSLSDRAILQTATGGRIIVCRHAHCFATKELSDVPCGRASGALTSL